MVTLLLALLFLLLVFFAALGVAFALAASDVDGVADVIGHDVAKQRPSDELVNSESTAVKQRVIRPANESSASNYQINSIRSN